MKISDIAEYVNRVERVREAYDARPMESRDDMNSIDLRDFAQRTAALYR